MSLPKAKSSFRFATQASLTRITNWKATNLPELLSGLKEVPDSAIFYHTHRFLEQHHFLSPEPPNDFAYWVTTALQDDRLAEKLAAIDTVRFNTIRDLRDKLARTVEAHLAQSKNRREALPGDEFYFLQSVNFVLVTPYEAWNLGEFAEALKKVSVRSLYFHIFEARLRPPLGRNDFSEWLEKSLNEPQLARAIEVMDPYTQTLEGLRARILHLIQKRIQQIEDAAQKEASHALAQ